MSTIPATENDHLDERSARLEAYRSRADPAIAIISTFYLVLLLIPRVAITSYESSLAITVLDVIFWIIITADVAFRLWLTTDRRERRPLVLALVLLLSGPFVFLAISPATRFLIRIALIAVISLRAINGVRYFFRLRTMLYIISAVIVIVVVFGVMMTVTERDAPNSHITSLGMGIWWSVVTVTTVGYGDAVPVTIAGRVIATGLMFFGVAMFGILTATLANAFANRTESTAMDQLSDIRDRLERIEQNQQGARGTRRTRAPKRPLRRIPPPRIGGEQIEED